MKTLFTLLYLLAAVLIVNASVPHRDGLSSPRHARLAHRAAAPTVSSSSKRCRSRPKSSVVAAHAPTTSSAKPPPPKATTTPSKGSSSDTSSNGASGLINVKSTCGPSGASKKVTATSGPNGDIDWLNCGINSEGGWSPPFLTPQDIITVPLSEAIKSSSSPFKACSKYVSMFEKYGDQNGIPGIILASFAMQESSCDPTTVGGAGEQGLMQITKDKCHGAPNGDCKNPDFNIRTGAKFFADTLKSNGNNLLLSIGQYNGWNHHMTQSQATAAARSDCCLCQRNLDYLQQFLNGWCQNLDAYSTSLRLGKYFNLDVCY